MRGGIAERGGVRVGHRIIEINGQSVVAMAHEKIVQTLSVSVGEVRGQSSSEQSTAAGAIQPLQRAEEPRAASAAFLLQPFLVSSPRIQCGRQNRTEM